MKKKRTEWLGVDEHKKKKRVGSKKKRKEGER
jgi:hypothetical protein